MKKTISLFLVLAFAVSVVFAHPVSEVSSSDKTSVRVAALKGPTAMGMVKLMDDARNGVVSSSNDYSFVLEGAADALVPMLAKNEIDIAAIPANLASTLYNNTGKLQVIGINTLGVLYIVGENGKTITSREDILGTTIYSAGKGSTPEYALQTVLKGFGLEVGKDVNIEWRSEHAECVAALKADPKALAMLPQPFATSAMAQLPDCAILLDLNDLWETLSGTQLVTGCAVVTTAFASQHPEAVEAFLADYGASVEWVNANAKEASVLIENEGIIKAAVAEKALPYCNIVLWTGEELKSAMEVYLNALYDANPKSVGGAVPGEEFYF